MIIFNNKKSKTSERSNLAFGVEGEDAGGLEEVHEALGTVGGVGDVVEELLALDHEPPSLPRLDGTLFPPLPQPPVQRQLQRRLLPRQGKTKFEFTPKSL